MTCLPMKIQPKLPRELWDSRAEHFYDYYWWDQETGAGTGFLFEYPNSWDDMTYGNDESPSCEHSLDFMNGPQRYRVRLWMDLPWVEERALERQDQERFQLALYYCEDNSDPTYGTEWIGDILASDDLHSLLEQLWDESSGIATIIRRLCGEHQRQLIRSTEKSPTEQLNDVLHNWCTCEELPIAPASWLLAQEVAWPLTKEQEEWLKHFEWLQTSCLYSEHKYND